MFLCCSREICVAEKQPLYAKPVYAKEPVLPHRPDSHSLSTSVSSSRRSPSDKQRNGQEQRPKTPPAAGDVRSASQDAALEGPDFRFRPGKSGSLEEVAAAESSEVRPSFKYRSGTSGSTLSLAETATSDHRFRSRSGSMLSLAPTEASLFAGRACLSGSALSWDETFLGEDQPLERILSEECSVASSPQDANAPPQEHLRPTVSSAAGGLAARRNFGSKLPLKVQILPANLVPGPRRSMRTVSTFAAHYILGAEVTSSVHRGVQLRSAVNRATGEEFVVKIRSKEENAGLKTSQWLPGSEFVLNLAQTGNIARVHDILEDHKAYYVVMEKVTGTDLYKSIFEQGAHPVEDVKEILKQSLVGLWQLHEAGHIHKDMKLENVMLERTPTSAHPHAGSAGRSPKTLWTPASPSETPISVKLIDFDTVEAFDPKTPKVAKDVLGTNQYIAQEAYDGQYSPASDIFAVGVMVYKLLTNKYPFKSDIFNDKPGENFVGHPKMLAIRHKLREYKVDWSHTAFRKHSQAADLLRSMLASRAEERPTAREALQHPWLQGPPTPSSTASPPSPPSTSSPFRPGDRRRIQ